MPRARPPMTQGIPRSTSTASGGATTRTSRRLIRRRCCIGRAKGRRRSWRIWATCCWIIHGLGLCARHRHTLLLEASSPPGHGRSRQGLLATSPCPRPGRHAPVAEVRWSADGRTTRALSRSQRKPRGTGQTVCASSVAASHSSIGSSLSPPRPITWSACGIWRRRVLDRRPRVSPAPSSGSAHTRAHCRRSVVTRMMLKKTARYPGQQPARSQAARGVVCRGARRLACACGVVHVQRQ